MALSVLDRLRPGQRGQIHWRAVMQDVDAEVWRRRQTLRAFRRPEHWQAHVDETRRRFLAAIGPLPGTRASGWRTPLHVDTSGVLERDGYSIEKLLVETQPGFFATANLYLPAHLSGPGKAPAILNAVGHWAGGKAEPVEQARMIGQARKGYVALIWDPIGQGERSQFWEDAAPLVNPSTYQHAEVGNAAFLVGSTVIATMLWDGIRMLDYLASRPEVDSERIGCTGVSGGGTYTMFLGMVDRRIKATVPVCSTSTLERKHRQGQVAEPCQFPVRSYADDMDTADFLMAHAPAALRVIGTLYDTFPLVGLREAFLDVQDCYQALGLEEKTDLCVVAARHDYNREQRELAYAWFNRWLDHDAPVSEEPFTPEDPSALWCTPTGHVLTSLPQARVARDLVRDLARRVIPAPRPVEAAAGAGAEQARVRAAALDLLGPIPPLDGEAPRALEPGTAGGLPVERVILQARLDVLLPALVFAPALSAPTPRPPLPGAGEGEQIGGNGTSSPQGTGLLPSPLVRQRPAVRAPAAILIDDRGKEAQSNVDGLALALARAGVLALAVDLRGWGETVWVNETFNWSADRRDPLSADTMLANIGLMLGRWSVTQRVQDVLGTLAYLRSRADVDPNQIALVGRGGGAVVALHAAAVDGQVARVVAHEMLGSYRAIVEAPRHVHPVADFVPSALLRYDLPDLAAALAPSPVLIVAPQDAAGAPLPGAEVDATYARARCLADLLGGTLVVDAGDAASKSDVRDRIVAWITTSVANPMTGEEHKRAGRC